LAKLYLVPTEDRQTDSSGRDGEMSVLLHFEHTSEAPKKKGSKRYNTIPIFRIKEIRKYEHNHIVLVACRRFISF